MSENKDDHIFDQRWDVLIVGAGPAGLFAALGIASNSSLKVLLIEAGSDIVERERTWVQQRESMQNRYNYVQGVGGAGLYSDGKLCFSLNIGGQLKTRLGREKKEALLRTISEYFGLLSEFDQMQVASDNEIEAIAKAANRAGLEFKYYPVLQIGTEECRDLIIGLRTRLEELGVTLVSHCNLKDMRESP